MLEMRCISSGKDSPGARSACMRVRQLPVTGTRRPPCLSLPYAIFRSVAAGYPAQGHCRELLDTAERTYWRTSPLAGYGDALPYHGSR